MLSRRAVSLAAALALRRGEPQEALALLQPRTDTDRAIPRDLLVGCAASARWWGGASLVSSRPREW